MPVEVRQRLEGVIQLFFWRGPSPATTRGGALVAWSTVCRPISQGGLEIRQIQLTNDALHAQRVLQVMQLSGDILSLVLRQTYGHSMDWDTWATPQRGDSPFIAGLRESFTQMQPFLPLSLATGQDIDSGKKTGQD